MKKRILALLLCCTLLLGLIPAAFTAAADADASFKVVDASGAAVSYVEVPQNGKFALTAQKSQSVPAGAYQWQISVPGTDGVWANILDAQGSTLELSYAMVANMLQSGLAYVRCRLTAGEQTLYTDAVSVAIGYAAIEQPAPMISEVKPVVISEAQPIGQPILTPAQSAPAAAPAAPAAPAATEAPATDPAPSADPAPADEAPTADEATAATDEAPAPTEASTEAPAADEAPTEGGTTEDPAANDSGSTGTNDAPSTYTVVIKYVFENGQQAANPWTADVATGTRIQQKVESPSVLGYEPDQKTVDVDASAEATYTVTYKPALVEYTVKHYQQNVTNDDYTLAETETKNGYTDDPIGAELAKKYDGFYSLIYDGEAKIAADGTTVVEIKYDRYYYLINFDLDGGYGVEPIYARYGSDISVGTPEKPGYTFKGWDKPIPKTMPFYADKGETITAKWEEGTSGFTVVFWYENADDDGYSVAGTYSPADVAPGTTVKSDTYKNQNFTGRDTAHFTYNDAKAETVTVSGDGSTVLNVYYTRNTYTLTFKNGQQTLTCTKTEHTHSDACCKYGGTSIVHWRHDRDCCKLGLSEHTHNSSCYKYSDLKITAKYGADIHGNFPINDSDGSTILWSVPSGCTSFKAGTYLASINTMPGENVEFKKYDSVSAATIWYYVEAQSGQTGTHTYNGKNFVLYKSVKYTKSGYLTYAEEFHDIVGFTQWASDPKFSSFDKNGQTSTIKNDNYLYYTRNSYNLEFYNYNDYVSGKGGSVQYEAPLSGYDFTPDYPENLEKNAYVFAGWYTTAGCYEGSEADLSKMTMPASDMILYAKWTSNTHTVKTYLTEDAMKSGENAENTWENIPHGSRVAAPADPSNGGYKFVGWFYETETGEEKAFDFSMPVNRDLELYAKWSSDTLMKYTIKYAIENADGSLTYIAAETTGSALAGSTKTFEAKTGKELNDGYQTGYFPKTSSHSIIIDITDAAKNEYTFIYVQKEKVPYTVKYLEKGTEVVLHEPKTVETSAAIVTETFQQIAGYAPDAYQKRLVLSVDDEQNVITFWYTKDDKHAPLKVIHWIQNIEGEKYTEYQSTTDLNGVIDTKYEREPLEIKGFKYNGTKSNASGTLPAEGLVLNLYYDRIEYPYEFRFLEQGTNTQLEPPVTGKARYQAQVTQTAKDILGYTLVSAENQAINIEIEDSAETAVKNVKTFYYTEQTVDIKYVVAGPDGCGTLDNYQDNTLKVKTGTPTGSAPVVNAGFKFVGWYKDEACTLPVDTDWVVSNKLTPQKTKDYGDGTMGYEAAIYYAKFEYDVADLTITKTGAQSIDENQSFIFEVRDNNGVLMTQVVIHGNGSVTIKGLKIGTYTVTEVTSWSWRYTPDAKSKEITLQPTGNNVTFDNTRTKGKWLSGDCVADNKFYQ